VPRATRREILKQLVDGGRLDPDDADSIARAPGWSFSTPELVGYVGAGLLAVGLIRLLIAAEASPSAIALLLLITGALSLLATRRIPNGSSLRDRLAELVEVAAALQLSIGAGILVERELLERADLAVALVATVTLIWGIRRLDAVLVGWIMVPAAALVAIAAWIGVADLADSGAPPVLALLAIALVGLASARSEQPGSLLARVAASGTLFAASMMWLSLYDGARGALPVIAAGVAWFALGSTVRWFESVGVGGLITVIGVVGWVLDSELGEVTQGLVIVAIGAVTLFAVGLVARRTPVADAA